MATPRSPLWRRSRRWPPARSYGARGPWNNFRWRLCCLRGNRWLTLPLPACHGITGDIGLRSTSADASNEGQQIPSSPWIARAQQRQREHCPKNGVTNELSGLYLLSQKQGYHAPKLTIT